MKINIEEAKEEFIKYTENFNTKDKNVKKKTTTLNKSNENS